jgi:hypothetical protein
MDTGQGRDRALEQTRRFTEARRKIDEVGVKGVGLGVHVGAQVAELAGRAAVAGALEGLGGAMLVAEMAGKYLEAHKEWQTASEQALNRTGIRLSMEVIGRDAQRLDNPHVRDGRPYTAGELDQRIMQDSKFQAWDRWADVMAGAGRDARKWMDSGLADATRMANDVMRQCPSPEARRAALGSLSQNIEQAIQELERQNLQRLQQAAGE